MFMIDMHGNPGPGDGVEQLAHAGRAVLRLLHRQRHQVVGLRIDALRSARGQLAGQRLRVDLDQARPAP
jgi:hypothetical protein